MPKDTYMKTTMKKKMIKKTIFSLVIATLFSSCVLSPGMFMSSSNNWSGENTVFVSSLNRSIVIEPITKKTELKKNLDTYKIGRGDQLFVTVWGLPDVFPLTSSVNID